MRLSNSRTLPSLARLHTPLTSLHRVLLRSLGGWIVCKLAERLQDEFNFDFAAELSSVATTRTDNQLQALDDAVGIGAKDIIRIQHLAIHNEHNEHNAHKDDITQTVRACWDKLVIGTYYVRTYVCVCVCVCVLYM